MLVCGLIRSVVFEIRRKCMIGKDGLCKCLLRMFEAESASFHGPLCVLQFQECVLGHYLDCG